MSATRKNYLNEATTPKLGISQGSVVYFDKQVTVAGSTGYLGLQINAKDGKSRSFTTGMKVEKIIYTPALKFVKKSDKEGYNVYKQADGTFLDTKPATASAKVQIKFNFGGKFTFFLTIRGGSSPSVQTTSFEELDSAYEFTLLGKQGEQKGETTSSLVPSNYVESVKSAFNGGDSENTLFGTQTWVTNIQKVI